MNAQADTNFRWAWALLDGLAACGLRRVVLSPGSRSTPLALAALRHPGLDAKVVLDERSAAFFALGLAKAEGVPVAVIATSGSAPANWYPAVIEADMARVPLLLLSADRPPELLDCGANQTTDQIALFGRHVRAFHQLPPAEADTGWLAGFAARLMARALGRLPGPVHVNLPLREPLVPAAAALPPGAPSPLRLAGMLAPSPESVATLRSLMAGRGGLIVCGPEDLGEDFRHAVTALAVRLGAPILADALSGLRFTGDAPDLILAHADAVARTAPRPDWVLRLGGMPVSRAVTELLARLSGTPQMVVADHGRVADATATATHLVEAAPAVLCAALADLAPAPAGWAAPFLARDRAAACHAEAACAGDAPLEGSVLRGLAASLPAGTALFLGNSLAVRAAEWFAGRSRHRLHPFGNRGLSGIDGTLSTLFGIAAARGRALAVVGDLTFLHDVGGLALARASGGVIVVLDNGGGGIFDHLAQAELPEFEAGWLTPQSADPAALATGFGVRVVRAGTVAAVVAAALDGIGRPEPLVIHVPVDRALSAARIRTFFAACTQGA